MSSKFNDFSCLDAQKLEDECYRKTKQAFSLLELYGYKWDNESNDWLSRAEQKQKEIKGKEPHVGACEMAARTTGEDFKDLSHVMGYGQKNRRYNGD